MRISLFLRIYLYQFPKIALHIDPPNPLTKGGAKTPSVAQLNEIGISGGDYNDLVVQLQFI